MPFVRFTLVATFGRLILSDPDTTMKDILSILACFLQLLSTGTKAVLAPRQETHLSTCAQGCVYSAAEQTGCMMENLQVDYEVSLHDACYRVIWFSKLGSAFATAKIILSLFLCVWPTLVPTKSLKVVSQ